MNIQTKANRIDILDERFYYVGETEDGPIYYPSVTFVLDCLPKGAGFEQWLKDVGNNAKVIAERAAESGTLVHNTIANMFKGIPVHWGNPINEDLKYHSNYYTFDEWKMLLRFKEFWCDFDCGLIASETQVVSPLGYAGTVDIVCEIAGEIWLIDIKTGNDVYDSAYLQVAAYAHAWNQQHPEQAVQRIGALHLRARTRGKKEGKLQGEGWRVDEPEEDIEYLFGKFMSVFEVFKYVNRGRKMEPLTNSYPNEISLTNVTQQTDSKFPLC